MRRRSFIKAILAAGAAPMVTPFGTLFGAEAPSNRVILASIGVGGEGSGLLNMLLQPPWIRMLAICDPFKSRREEKAGLCNKTYSWNSTEAVEDFRTILGRKDIDGIVCATPDHWHHNVAIQAMKAGKDVYIEKPLTPSINDDKEIRDTVRACNRVFQYGTQQRSSSHIRQGCELVRAGVLGKLSAIHVVAPAGAVGGGSLAPLPVPDGFNYDLWKGPSADRPYTADRCTSAGSWYSSYCSIGFLGGWGAHPLDVMCWALNDKPEAVPVEITAKGKRDPKALFDTIGKWDAHGKFANGIEFTFTDGPDRTTFVGENGKIMISRSSLRAEPMDILRTPLPQRTDPLRANLTGFHHVADFARCIQTRETPCSNIEGAYYSDTISHLTNIACLTGRAVKWDIAAQTIVGDSEQQKMMARASQRKGYEI